MYIKHRGTGIVYQQVSADQYNVVLLGVEGRYPSNQFDPATQEDWNKQDAADAVGRRVIHLSFVSNRHYWICGCTVCRDAYEKSIVK